MKTKYKYYIFLILFLAGGLIMSGCGNDSTGPETQKYQVKLHANPVKAGKVFPASKKYEAGSEATINAIPNDGYRFKNWTGDYTGTEAVTTITVDASMNITANFVKKSYTLKVDTVGKGIVKEKVISAASTSNSYEGGTTVQLTVKPATGWMFDHWEGDLKGSDNPQRITIDSPKHVTAVFVPTEYTLTIHAENGAVKQEIVNVSANSTKSYKPDIHVKLTANPAKGFIFDHWEGDLTGSKNPQVIIMNSPKTVTAVFKGKTYQLNLSTKGNGNGSIKVDPKKSAYRAGTVITLTAIPGKGQRFAKWIGDVSGGSSTDNPLHYTVGISNNITAVFKEVQNFILASNGVTVKCPDADFGDKGSVNGVVYTKRKKSKITPENAARTCTSGITNMKSLFKGDASFNADISSWDVSNVTNMRGMFRGATSFNAEINSWDVSKVETMENMFRDTHSFNQDIGGWGVSSVTNMHSMFNSSGFNKDISNWDVSNVKDMRSMFKRDKHFNQDLRNWDVSNVTNMAAIFMDAKSFNGNIASWDVSNVTNMKKSFSNAQAFNQDISSWDVSNVTNMQEMFAHALSFNQDISNWNVSKVKNMKAMFHNAREFDQDLSGWCVKNISSKPKDFAAGSKLSSSQLPVWGTCPSN